MKERKEVDQWWCKVKDEESKKVAGEAPETKNTERMIDCWQGIKRKENEKDGE